MSKIISSFGLLNELTPALPENIISGITEGYNYFFNPQGHYGPVILKDDALKVFNLCNGKNNLTEIKNTLYCEKINPQKIEEIITNLAIYELINLSPEINEKIKRLRIQNRKKKMFVWLQLTDSCNLKCNYCYINKQETYLDYELSKKLINKIVNDCVKEGFNEIIFKFADGEPILRWEQVKSLIDWTNKIYDNSQNLTIRFHIITNCTVLPKDLITYIKEGKLGISISLDGVGKWHDIYRRYKNTNEGSFKDVDKNIEKLLCCGITPRVLSTVTNANVFGLKELAKYCIDMSLGFRLSLYRETAKSEEELKSDNELLIENLKSCYAYIKENLPKISLYQCHKFGDVNLRSPRMRGCGMGVNNLIMNSNENMFMPI